MTKLEDRIDTQFFSIVENVFSECQAIHSYDDECTVVAVARLFNHCTDTQPRKVCQMTVDYVDECHDLGAVCGSCNRGVVECWELLPL